MEKNQLGAFEQKMFMEPNEAGAWAYCPFPVS